MHRQSSSNNIATMATSTIVPTLYPTTMALKVMAPLAIADTAFISTAIVAVVTYPTTMVHKPMAGIAMTTISFASTVLIPKAIVALTTV